MAAKGIGEATAFPPAWHVLWSMGAKVLPPPFLGFAPLALITGGLFGPLFGLGAWMLGNRGPPSAPTSQNTARGRKRTTDPPRAHRPLWLRDTPPATKPVLSAVEGPKAKQGKTTRSGNEPAGKCSARCRESARVATDGEASRPRDAEIPLANVRSAPKLALARPPPTRQSVQKGRLNCLYSGLSP